MSKVRRRLRRGTRYAAIAAAALFILVIVSAIVLWHQKRMILLYLSGQQEAVQTIVYSRPLVLTPDKHLKRSYIMAWLDLLGWRYQREGSTLLLNRPPQPIRLQFSNDRLERIETLETHQALPSFQVDPTVLAHWTQTPEATRQRVLLSDLPPYIPQAVLAIEDRRFYEHPGVDIVGLMRAVWADLRHRNFVQGGSTISQQLARSIFLTTDRTFKRKLIETAIALYLETRYPKEKLLEMYLNQVYWGNDAGQTLLGIGMAARAYFGKPPEALSLGEAAMLAGLLQSPNRYSPRAHFEKALERRRIVLELMTQQTKITPKEQTAALAQKLQLVPPASPEDDAAYFVAMIADALADDYGNDSFTHQSSRIDTTLDPVLQHAAVMSVKPPKGEAALVTLDAQTGAIRCWVGGSGFRVAPFDRARNALRHPGSAFKPIVVATALESGKATASTILEDKPMSILSGGRQWSPQNHERTYRGQVMLWEAMVRSLNVPMVHLGVLVGPENIAAMGKLLGIKSTLQPFPSLALGASEVSLLELTSVYGTFADHGMHHTPYAVERISDKDGKVIAQHAQEGQRVISEETSAIVTAMLQAVINNGTAFGARQEGLTAPMAGKTGTSENYHDAWFIGYTPMFVTGVWVGYDLPKSLGHSASSVALPLWTAFMKHAEKSLAWDDFVLPSTVHWKTIDTETGELVRNGCLSRKDLPFADGHVPPECSLHRGGLIGFFQRLRGKR